MKILDIIVIAVIALSALFAFARGFVKEALGIAAWIGAGAVALYGLALGLPYAQQVIANPMLAKIATGAILFVVSLVVFSMVTSAIAGRVQHSALSAIDRALGLAFGVARGVLLVCVGFIAVSWAIQGSEPPIWMREARSPPFFAGVTELLKSLIPADARARGAATAAEAEQNLQQARDAERLMRALTSPREPAPAATKPAPPGGYNQTQRRGMDQLFQSTR
jgi:membrane protein required for colicin V production